MTTSEVDTPTHSEKLDFQRTDEFYKTARTLIRTIGWVTVMYIFYLLVGELAGKDTSVNVLAKVLVSILINIKLVLSITLAGTACAWAFAERKLRHRKVEKLQSRIRQLETIIDPERSTSGLTPRGETNPSDRGA